MIVATDAAVEDSVVECPVFSPRRDFYFRYKINNLTVLSAQILVFNKLSRQHEKDRKLPIITDLQHFCKASISTGPVSRANSVKVCVRWCPAQSDNVMNESIHLASRKALSQEMSATSDA